MSKSIPQISKYMTPMPHTIEPTQTLTLAKKWMKEYHVRHLPVLSGGKVVGLLSERDISLLATFKGVNLETAQVMDAMVPDPYIVTPEAPITEVAAEMAERKLGSALVVQQNGTLVGVFTYVDGFKVLAHVFDERLKK